MVTRERAIELQSAQRSITEKDIGSIAEGLRIMYVASDSGTGCKAAFNILSGPELHTMPTLEESDVVQLLHLGWNFDSLHNRFMISL